MTYNKNLILRHKATVMYGVCMAVLLLLLKWLELRFVIFSHSYEVYVGCIAVLFTALGIWLALRLSKPKVETVVVEKEIYRDRVIEKEVYIPQVIEKEIHVPAAGHFVLNASMVARLELSKRELNVLDLMAKGHSNQEIAATLFVSLSTVKTHNQNIFEKLDVKRRTQAVEKARRLALIP